MHKINSICVLATLFCCVPAFASITSGNRCVVKNIQMIHFSNYVRPMSESSYHRRCLLEVNSEPDVPWRLVIGGRDKIVLIEQGVIVSLIDLHASAQLSDYVIEPYLSNEYVLMGYLSCGSSPKTMRLYSFDNGTYFNVIEDRSITTVGDWTTSFLPVLGGDCVYFNDVAGYFGGYSRETGNLEYDFTGRGSEFTPGYFPISPIVYSVSADGSLYAAAMQQTPKEVIGYSLEEELLWRIECQSYAGIGISDDGAFVAFDKFRDGILFVNGRTGEILSSFLANCTITSGMDYPDRLGFHLSPNGRFIGATFASGDSSHFVAEENYLTCIDTRYPYSSQHVWSFSDCGLNFPKVMDVADDGSLLIRDIVGGRVQYILLSISGEKLWEYEVPPSSEVADVAYTGTGYIIGYMDELLGEATFIELGFQ